MNQTKLPQAAAYRLSWWYLKKMVLASSQPWRNQDELNFRRCYPETCRDAVPMIVAIYSTASIVHEAA